MIGFPDPIGVILGFALLFLVALFFSPFFKAGDFFAKKLGKDIHTSEGKQISGIIVLIFLKAYIISL